MKRLFVIDKKDYDPNSPHSKRPSARAIIFSGEKLAMVYSTRDKYYKLPGGGIDEGENREAALIREVREETGLCVIPESIREYGSVLRLKKSEIYENCVFEQESFYYFCEVTDELAETALVGYEVDEGFTLRYVTPEEALAQNKNSITENSDMINRENAVLELLIKLPKSE